MLKNKRFVIPKCASDEVEAEATVDDLFSALGVSNIQETESNQIESDEPQETPEEDTSDIPSEEEEAQASTDEDNSIIDNSHNIQMTSRANEAFAQLRVENKKYQNMMKGIAELLGVQTNDPNAILSNVQNAITQAQAKQQGIPPELLARMNQLEESNNMFIQNEIRKDAYLGFQRIKDKFSLDNHALNSFADGLVQEGLNPFEQQLDLEMEYIKRNYAKIIADAEARGAEKEAKRAARASTRGTSPDNRQGGEATQGVEKINTIGDLDKWFRNQSK